MRFVQKETTTFLVREKGFNTKALGIQPTRLLGGSQIGDQIQWVFIAFGPTTDEHNRTIRGLCKAHLREGDEPSRLETPPQGIEAKGFALPRCCHMTPRATHIGPAGVCQRLLEV